VVVGASKASARMAQALEAAWGPQKGLVVVPDGGLLPLHEMEVTEASHPVPDGALWLPEMRERATLAEARDHLARYDAWGFFAKVDGLVETGPTHTNVNDFRAALVEEPA
jgi:glycerate-2-kinase